MEAKFLNLIRTDFRATKVRDTDNPSRNESYRPRQTDRHALKFSKEHKQANTEFPDEDKPKKTEALRSIGSSSAAVSCQV